MIISKLCNFYHAPHIVTIFQLFNSHYALQCILPPSKHWVWCPSTSTPTTLILTLILPIRWETANCHDNWQPTYITRQIWDSKHFHLKPSQGETREQRILQFHEIPGSPPVLALRLVWNPLAVNMQNTKHRFILHFLQGGINPQSGGVKGHPFGQIPCQVDLFF